MINHFQPFAFDWFNVRPDTKVLASGAAAAAVTQAAAVAEAEAAAAREDAADARAARDAAASSEATTAKRALQLETAVDGRTHLTHSHTTPLPYLSQLLNLSARVPQSAFI